MTLTPRLTCLLVIVLPLCLAQKALVPASPRGVKVLAIGINNYPYLGSGQIDGNLHNAVNDATDFVDMCVTRVGVPRSNIQLLTAELRGRVLTRADIEKEVADFYRRLQAGDIAIFFYSGHGVQVENDPSPNFLVPSDVRSDTLEVDLVEKAYPLGRVIRVMEAKKAGLRLLFVDACRNNPLIEEQKRVRALNDAPVDSYRPPQNLANGTVIGYAVSPGEKALDQSPNRRNGMYTYYLLRNLPRPGVDVIDALRDLAADVHQSSGEKMTPSYYGNLLARVSLVPAREPERKPEPVSNNHPDPPIATAFSDKLYRLRIVKGYPNYIYNGWSQHSYAGQLRISTRGIEWKEDGIESGKSNFHATCTAISATAAKSKLNLLHGTKSETFWAESSADASAAVKSIQAACRK